MGGPGKGHLSFGLPGWSLALDFPVRPGLDALMSRLHKIVRDCGGMIYLAKDSMLGKEDFAAMYPRLPAFIESLERVDPDRRMHSAMAERLGIRGLN